MIVNNAKPVNLKLSRDLTRSIKRGHPWVFADALASIPPAPAGTPALLHDRKGKPLARGFYEPLSPLAFRVLSPDAKARIGDGWARARFDEALSLRQGAIDARTTTGYRLFNGEGDGLPGLVCDIYGDAAAVRLDGPGAAAFWAQGRGVGPWLAQTLGVKTVYVRERGAKSGEAVIGVTPTEAVPFMEHGRHFTADLVKGQKTGFFLDQRENRRRIGEIAGGKRVLNLFAYTGGFSIYAGTGGAEHVTTVDLAAPAVAASEAHWALNQLAAERHAAISADVFDFLGEATKAGHRWDVVIADPPSFAPRQSAAPAAVAAYTRLVAAAARVTRPSGLLVAASCSSHVDLAAFMGAIQEGISKARRRARVLEVAGQGLDHPSPLALPEFRYLKFVLMAVA